MKYFNYSDLDNSVPILSFVGRITLQKGVILILECAEAIINKYGGKINILVGGAGEAKDPYVQNCWKKIDYLRGKYPNSFWANPNEFFTGKIIFLILNRWSNY
jgi:glycogen synthase